MMTNEQMDTLIGRLKVYGSESGRGKDHPNAIACRTAASVIIEQQAEIDRLREACKLLIALDADDDEVIVRRADWRRIRNLVKGQDQ